MKHLWQFARADWCLFLWAAFFMFFAVAADLLQPTLMAMIVDNGVANRDYTTIYRLSAIMLITTLVGFISGAISFYLSARNTSKAGLRLRSALFDHILDFSHRELDTLSVSTLITRMTNDVNQVQNVLLASQRIFVRVPLLLFGGLIMAIRLSPKLSLIFLVAIPALSTCIFLIMRRALKIYPTVQKRLDALNSHVRETLLGIRVIKGYQAEELESDKFSKRNNGLFEWQLKAQLNNLILSPFIMIIFNYSMIAILWFGGYQVYQGNLEVGKIMAFVTYMSQILNAVMMSSFVFLMISRAQTSLNRIDEVFALESSIVNANHTREPTHYEIVFNNVSFEYYEESQNVVLDNINLTIYENERLGIIGPTGCGKTSLISLIPRLYDVKSGSITIGGIDVRNIPLEFLRTQVGLAQQQSTILSGSIEENMRLVDASVALDDIYHALDSAQIQELYQRSDDGIFDGLQQRGLDLSGGQKQRLSIARVLLQKPQIIIVDDSTSALDILTEKSILNHLDMLRKHQTQIIIGQRIATMQTCDRIVVMNDGKIDAVGTHDTLLNNNEIYRTIALSQLGEEVVA